MIPGNIGKEHVIKAIEEIQRVGFPGRRSSTKYLLKHNNEYYPPKYVVCLANKHINGKMLEPFQFGGGNETNGFLERLGFEIVRTASLKKPIPSSVKRDGETRSSRPRHNERCPLCKEVIKRLLEKIYGRVEQNYRFEVGTHPEDFVSISYFEKLREIHLALQNIRGFEEFVKRKILPRVDFFAVEAKLIVEFDESQHFTLPRKVALENYPEQLELGFDRRRWIDLCKKINAKDNDPLHRDEQRAWYDTLRDFVPLVRGLKPTTRLFARDFIWCSLDPNNPSSLEKFEKILKKTSGRTE